MAVLQCEQCGRLLRFCQAQCCCAGLEHQHSRCASSSVPQCHNSICSAIAHAAFSACPAGVPGRPLGCSQLCMLLQARAMVIS